MAIPELIEMAHPELESVLFGADISRVREGAAIRATCLNAAFRVKMLAGKSS